MFIEIFLSIPSNQVRQLSITGDSSNTLLKYWLTPGTAGQGHDITEKLFDQDMFDFKVCNSKHMFSVMFRHFLG